MWKMKKKGRRKKTGLLDGLKDTAKSIGLMAKGLK